MKDNKQKLDNYIKFIESEIENFIPETKDEYKIISEAMKYSLTAGGKRIRPVLCLEFCNMLCGDYEKALGFAVAVEFIHTYSLIHDDLPCMDNDDFRRGKPSSHKQFGEAFALLAGDSLLTHAFSAAVSGGKITDRQKVEGIKYLTSLAGVNGMIGGQVIDLITEDKESALDEMTLMDLLKTSALIKCACITGCIAADRSDLIEKASQFADNLGIAFQIVDDILDYNEGENNSDIVNNKSTYVSVSGLENAEKSADEYTKKALEALEYFNCDTSFLRYLAENLLKRTV